MTASVLNQTEEPVKEINRIIRGYLPFSKPSDGWRRIEALQSENQQIVQEMMRLVRMFRLAVSEPREIYLTVQEVRSKTVYCRWRRKGVKGKQSYLMLNSIEGRDYLLRQPVMVRKLLINFDRWALALNLAHSLRLAESKRIRQYLETLAT